MNIYTKRAGDWLGRHPKARQWAWFALLWCGGLMTAVACTYPVKLLMRHL